MKNKVVSFALAVLIFCFLAVPAIASVDDIVELFDTDSITGDIASWLGHSEEDMKQDRLDTFYDIMLYDEWNICGTYNVSLIDSASGTFSNDFCELFKQQYTMFYLTSGDSILEIDSFIEYAKQRYLDGTSISDTANDFGDQATASPVSLSSKDFKTVLGRLNDQYSPSQLKDQFLASYQTLSIVKKDGEKFMYFPLRYGSDMIFGKGYNDLYLLPFVSDGSDSYFCSNQLHVYHDLVDDVPYIYIDVVDISSGSVSSSLSMPLLHNGSTSLPFVKLSFTQWSTYPNMLYFLLYADNLRFLTYDVSGMYRESGLDLGGRFIISTDLNSSSSFYDLYSASTFTPNSDFSDDYGFYCSTSGYSFDDMYSGKYTELSNNIREGDIITFTGDTINDYTITNAEGDSTTINNYITNNYTYPVSDTPSGDSGGSSDGSLTGNVTVGGKIDVGGAVDVNVNVDVTQQGSVSGTSSPVVFDPSGYLVDVADEAEPVTDFLSIFFDFLPSELLVLLVGGVAVAIWCRIFGR